MKEPNWKLFKSSNTFCVQGIPGEREEEYILSSKGFRHENEDFCAEFMFCCESKWWKSETSMG